MLVQIQSRALAGKIFCGRVTALIIKYMLYTKKGDDGTTKTFGCDQRVSKSSSIAEALGSLDEINSFLGLCKVQSAYLDFKLGETSLSDIVHEMQKNLFIIQAELAGAPKSIEENKVKELEEIVDSIEKELPPIKSFLVSGEADNQSTDGNRKQISKHTRSYLNRLSSALYALARYSNHKVGIMEEA